LPEKLSQLRAEFRCLRDKEREHEQRLDGAETVGEQEEIIRDYNEFWETFCGKMKNRTTRIVYRIWDVMKHVTPLEIAKEAIDKAIEWDKQEFILKRYKELLDVQALVQGAPAVQSQFRDVERLFGKPIGSEEWRRYTEFASGVEADRFPKGRPGSRR
jgi:hypothetical protein